MVHRTIKIGINGIRATIIGRMIVVSCSKPLRTLSSAAMNGGWSNARTVINHQVRRDYDCRKPKEYLRCFVERKLKLKGPVVGMMTAADIHRFALTKSSLKKLSVVAIITADLSNPARERDEAINSLALRGTMNIILIIDGNPSEGCTVEVIKTATEAKAAAIVDLDIRNLYSRGISTGAVADTIAILSTGRGKTIDYAGTATKLGCLVTRVVRNGIEEAIARQEQILRGRPLIHRLLERGISLHDLVETGMELIVPGSGTHAKNLAMLRRELTKALRDVNVEALILAAVRLEEDGRRGLIPGLTADNFQSDPITLVADESIGLAIANYLAGTWGIYNFLRYDRVKPGIMKKLGPFMDDAIGGLIAGAMTRTMTER